MKRFIQITYKIPGSDFATKEKIKALGDWMNYFEGSWLVLTDYTAKEAFERITTHLPDERFLVTEVNVKSYWGIMPKEAWDWLQRNSARQGL